MMVISINISLKSPKNVFMRCHYHSYCFTFGGARGVMVIVIGNGHGDTSSNPRRG